VTSQRGRSICERDESRVENFVRLTRLTREERRDPIHLLALERALQLAAEVRFDIGHHVLAGRGQRVPAHCREVVRRSEAA
jgi:uncharacterized protein YutE (UPF0331/DUF86 family)